jgi:hypothetical protein
MLVRDLETPRSRAHPEKGEASKDEIRLDALEVRLGLDSDIG